MIVQDLPPEALAQIKAAQELAKHMSQQAVAGMQRPMSNMPMVEAPSAVVAAAQAAASQIAQKVGGHSSAIICVGMLGLDRQLPGLSPRIGGISLAIIVW